MLYLLCRIRSGVIVSSLACGRGFLQMRNTCCSHMPAMALCASCAQCGKYVAATQKKSKEKSPQQVIARSTASQIDDDEHDDDSDDEDVNTPPLRLLYLPPQGPNTMPSRP